MARKPDRLPADLPNPLPVRVTPQASAEGVSAEQDAAGGWRVKARVTAPPAGGKANAAVIALLAKALGVPKSALTIVAGHASRDKLVRVER